VTTSLIDDADYWRKRAEEARALAEQMKDPHTQSLMLGIAESYDKIAKWAAERTGEPR
jgi:DNA-binding ferritin-like protein